MDTNWMKVCSNTQNALHAAMEIQMATLTVLIKENLIDGKAAYLVLDKLTKRKKFKDNEFAQNIIQAYKDSLSGKIDLAAPEFDMTNIIKFPSKKK